MGFFVNLPAKGARGQNNIPGQCPGEGGDMATLTKIAGAENALAWLRRQEARFRAAAAGVPGARVVALIPRLDAAFGDAVEVSLEDPETIAALGEKRIQSLVVGIRVSGAIKSGAGISRVYLRDEFQRKIWGVEEEVPPAADPRYCKVCGLGPVPNYSLNLEMLRKHEEHCEKRQDFIRLLGGVRDRATAAAIIDQAARRCGVRTYLFCGNSAFLVKEAGVPEEVLKRVASRLEGMTREEIERKYRPLIRWLDTSAMFARPDFSGYGTGARYAHPMHTESS